MEEATISGPATGQEKPGLSEYVEPKIPTTINTDDLVFELGRQTVERLNRDKVFGSLIEKTRSLDAVVKKQAATTLKLSESNQAYQDTNKALDKALSGIRVENDRLSRENVDLRVIKSKHEDLIIAHGELEADAAIQKDKAEKQIESLKKKLKTATNKLKKKKPTAKVKTDGEHNTGKKRSGSQSTDA